MDRAKSFTSAFFHTTFAEATGTIAEVKQSSWFQTHSPACLLCLHLYVFYAALLPPTENGAAPAAVAAAVAVAAAAGGDDALNSCSLQITSATTLSLARCGVY